MNNAPIPYMERTRMYYRALGYSPDYRWAQNGTPFTHLTPLKGCEDRFDHHVLPAGRLERRQPAERSLVAGGRRCAGDLYNRFSWDKS